MLVPKPITIAIITFAFPVLVSVAFWLQLTTIGEVFISSQVALLAFQIQKYFWSEADYHNVKRFLFREK
jgi:hypothetical protein